MVARRQIWDSFRIVLDHAPDEVLTNGTFQSWTMGNYLAAQGMAVRRRVDRRDDVISLARAAAVRKVLETHNRGRMHDRKHAHYLKGLLTCSCGSKMGLTLQKGKYLYFFCLRRSKCGHYVRASVIEEQVEELYQKLHLPDLTLKRLEKELVAEIERQEASKIEMAQGLERRVQRMDREQDKLMQAYYADAIPVEVLKREQDRIVAEKVILQGQIQGMDRRIAEAASS